METNFDTAGTAGSTSINQGQDIGGQGSDARSLVDRGKERVRTTVDDGKTRVARSLGTVAIALKDSGRQMEGEAAPVGTVVERVADQLDRAANYLERSNVDEIVSGVERFARRNPALFLGAAFAVGVLGARFLKASRTDVVALEGGADASGTFGDREVRTQPVGAADLATGTSGTGTVTGPNDLTTGLD